jgi:hypothetical protein
MENVITLAEAAKRADRSKACLRRWIAEGWLTEVHQLPGRNGVWLLDEAEFTSKLPHLLETMEARRGGQGKKEPDAFGQPRD